MKNTLQILLFAGILPVSAITTAAGSHDDGHGHEEKSQMETHMDGDHDHSDSMSAVGIPANASDANTVIYVNLLDTMRFEFDKPLALNQGDTVRFVVNNLGKIRHEFSIGNETEQIAHRVMMQKMPDMMHEDGNTVSVEPGKTKELTWKFSANEKVVFACNIPGHAEAGMQASTELLPEGNASTK